MSDYELINDTPYLTLSGELRSVFYDYFGGKRKWLCYKEFQLYMGQVTKVRLSCYLVLLSNNSKTRQQDNLTFVTLPIQGSV